jgi:hypothetical protein
MERRFVRQEKRLGGIFSLFGCVGKEKIYPQIPE